jgi:hypothetical protein
MEKIVHENFHALLSPKHMDLGTQLRRIRSKGNVAERRGEENWK